MQIMAAFWSSLVLIEVNLRENVWILFWGQKMFTCAFNKRTLLFYSKCSEIISKAIQCIASMAVCTTVCGVEGSED